MDKDLLYAHREILHKLDAQKGEFFYNERTGFAKDIFKRIKTLNRNVEQWIRIFEKKDSLSLYVFYSDKNFQKEIKKTITLTNQLMTNKRVYWGNHDFLMEIKEQLESLSVMVDLTK